MKERTRKVEVIIDTEDRESLADILDARLKPVYKNKKQTAYRGVLPAGDVSKMLFMIEHSPFSEGYIVKVDGKTFHTI